MWRVMLADDERYVLTGLRTLIPWQSLDCEVVAEAANGQELLRLVETIGADIAVLDIRMPGIDGLDAAKLLRRDHPEIVLIFLTGYEDFQYARAAVDVGAAAYIVKTEVLEELPAALRKAAHMLSKSHIAPESPAMLALLRSLCDGTFAIRRVEEAFSGAYALLCQGFDAGRVLAAELGQTADALEMDNLKLLLESSFRRFSPALFPMADTRLCLLLRHADAPPEGILAECEALLPVVESFCGFCAAFAVSGSFTQPEGMRAAYAEVDGLLSQRLRDGDAHVLVTREPPSGTGAASSPKALGELLAGGSEEAQQAWLKGLMDSLRETNLIAARAECLHALSAMSTLCDHYDRQLRAPDGDFSAQILTAQTLAQLRDTLASAMRLTVALVTRENEKLHALIKATNAYIAQHAYQKVSLGDIANAVHANPSHLSRFYKEKTGRNLFDVINGMRVERAAELMRTTDLRTYEIADAVGFSDTSNFSKFFKKHTGLSPREYARGEGRSAP